MRYVATSDVVKSNIKNAYFYMGTRRDIIFSSLKPENFKPDFDCIWKFQGVAEHKKNDEKGPRDTWRTIRPWSGNISKDRRELSSN